MKKILFTLALIVSFNSFGQNKCNLNDIIESNWSKKSVRNFYDNFSENCNRELKEIEGIYSGRLIEMNEIYGESFYEVAIFYFPDEDYYKAYIMQTSNPFRKSTKIGDLKITFEESAMGGDYDVVWRHSPKRNKKGKIKKPGISYRADAISELEGQTITFTGGAFNGYTFASGSLIKKYPRQ